MAVIPQTVPGPAAMLGAEHRVSRRHGLIPQAGEGKVLFAAGCGITSLSGQKIGQFAEQKRYSIKKNARTAAGMR
jgi:hypothetical protein